MPSPKAAKYKAVLVKCSVAEHGAVMQYAKVVGRGVGPMLRSVPFNVLVRRATRFNGRTFGSEADSSRAITAEWAWLGSRQTDAAKA